MRTELPRQFIHLSGLLFIILAQFIPKEITITYFLLIALFFLSYSLYIRREERKLTHFIKRLENKFRDFAMRFEREEYFRAPFQGAFWFYFSCALALLLFPFNIASAACCMLAVGDSLSTLIGVKFGRHKIVKKKTLEGSLALLTSSFVAGMFFVNPVLSFAGALAAAFAELLPKINDNLTIPLISGSVMLLFSLL